MAFVEHGWFHEGWLGERLVEPWSAVDWDATPDWDLESAGDDTPDELGAALPRVDRAQPGCDRRRARPLRHR